METTATVLVLSVGFGTTGGSGGTGLDGPAPPRGFLRRVVSPRKSRASRSDFRGLGRGIVAGPCVREPAPAKPAPAPRGYSAQPIAVSSALERLGEIARQRRLGLHRLARERVRE